MSVALSFHRSLHRRPGGWTPKQLGTLSLWLDADDATTVTISTGVSQWDDKSGNARHATQGTGANQPAWTKGAQNGRAVLRFDGSNHFLTCGDVLDLLDANLSVAVAFKSATTGRALISKTGSGINVNGEWHLLTDAQARTQLGGTAFGSAVSHTTSASQLAWVLDRGAASTVWRSGTQAITHTTSPLPNTTSYNIADALLIGARNDTVTPSIPSIPFNGDLYEVVVSLTALSTDDRQKVEGYLAHKWGTTASLPSDHPYKSVAP